MKTIVLLISYILRVNSADLTHYDVEMRIHGAPDSFTLAMARHPEYDDRFYRYVENLTISSGTIVRADSQLWRVTLPGGDGVVRYVIHLPPAEQPRAAWRPFLAPTGGLVGGPHSFMYIVGQEGARSTVTLDLPAGWQTASSLPPNPNVDELMENPILIGRLRTWTFTVRGVPHHIVYWPLPNATPFDTTAFAAGIEHIAQQAFAVFGRSPYREFNFLIQDGAYGGLEHPASVTLGVPSAELAHDPTADFREVAHEYFHTWNLMSIRPISYRGVSYQAPEPAAELWFSEGLSMFYSDLMLRRAGVALPESTRVRHLENLIARYLASPGNSHFSAEAISRVAYNSAPGALGDYNPGVHLPGELIGGMLDFIIRDATDGRRSIDDLMRAMNDRFGGREAGFTSAGVERAAHDVCGCEVGSFFDAYVRNAGSIDFARYLAPLGFTIDVTRVPALGRDSQPAPDQRIRAWTREGESAPRLVMFDPSCIWGRAGLHTNDVVTRWNGAPVTGDDMIRAAIGRVRIGDTVTVEVMRPSGPYRTTVVVTGYDRPVARITASAGADDRQRRIREQWIAGR